MISIGFLSAIIAFVASITGYPVPQIERPSVIYTSLLPADVGATYNTRIDMIFIRETFNERSIRDQATLAHEITHWLQDANNRLGLPVCRLEQEAYRVGDRYRILFHQPIDEPNPLRQKATECPASKPPAIMKSTRP